MSKPFQLSGTAYCDGLVILHVSKYQGGETAAYLSDAETGEPVCKVSVNFPESKLEDGFIFVKDYAENAGIMQALIDAGIIEETPEGIGYKSGFCEYPICKLTPLALEK